ncbi:c-type cytochrome [Erythrobacter sp. MTPC3]|uniref:c-type cytochrome n=1 Tax=Erythrobacter sp. MTPC3 TaxID=3056564 RepID=UPI0036F1C6A8
MMSAQTRNRIAAAIALSAAPALAACGEEPEELPVIEQIVVREPGQPIAAAVTGGGAADLVAAGEAAFSLCSSCHVAEPGQPSAAGPNLHSVVGREAGALDDFAYSDALTASGITWDAAQLDRFLTDPSAAVPGTSMAAGAVADADRRAAIIAYLASLGQ